MADYRYHVLSAANWQDFELLFGPKGACAGCWCTLNRRARKDFESGKGEPNRVYMQQLVASGAFVGIIMYAHDQPAGWLSMGHRSAFPGSVRSRVMKPSDNADCWIVSCFFIDKKFRNQGLSSRILGFAADEARKQGAKGLEGFPLIPVKTIPDVFAWNGIQFSFIKAGFNEVARPLPNRPVMRISW